MPFGIKKLSIVTDIFQQANFGKSFDKKTHFFRLKVILDACLTK
jgi:hypothetical protein